MPFLLNASTPPGRADGLRPPNNTEELLVAAT